MKAPCFHVEKNARRCQSPWQKPSPYFDVSDAPVRWTAPFNNPVAGERRGDMLKLEKIKGINSFQSNMMNVAQRS